MDCLQLTDNNATFAVYKNNIRDNVFYLFFIMLLLENNQVSLSEFVLISIGKNMIKELIYI